MSSAKFKIFLASLLLCFTSPLPAQNPPAAAQQISSFDRGRTRMMLENIANDIRKHYYDPKFHGIDWEARVGDTKQKIDKAAGLNMAFSNIAGALDSLNDSHTFFLPPSRPYRHDFGLELQMIGDRCLVSRVRPDTDAAAKGLKPGDEVLAFNGFRPTRQSLWKLEYVYNTLRPAPGVRLVVQSPEAAQRQVDVLASMRQLHNVVDLTTSFDLFDLIRDEENEEHRLRARSVEYGDDLMVLKFPEWFMEESQVDAIMGKARKHKALIVDLRQNPGGSVDVLKYMLGSLFDHEIKIGDRVTRDSTKPMTAKPRSHNYFQGKLLVLVDSRSASASELFARVVQLEKRGTVIGDHSSGSVMESMHYTYKQGLDTIAIYGASITDANIVMADGTSLEHNGVSPDELVLPTPAELAAGKDPVLAHAAELCGVKLSPEEAGKLFPYEWAKR
ncbi:MAG: S41 family peptidase [Terriglobales bacterium]|jgi:carboxyl-terminal processing protease